MKVTPEHFAIMNIEAVKAMIDTALWTEEFRQILIKDKSPYTIYLAVTGEFVLIHLRGEEPTKRFRLVEVE